MAGVDSRMSENIEIRENGNGVTNPGFHIDSEDEKKVLGLISLLKVTVAYARDVFVDDISCTRVVRKLLRKHKYFSK